MGRVTLARATFRAGAIVVLACASEPGLLRAQVPGTAPANADPLMVRGLLHARDFRRLESLFAAYADSMRADIVKETLLLNSFAAFGLPDPLLRPQLDAWVEAEASAAAYVARAAHLAAMGWEARGTNYAAKTRRAQFDKMEEWFEEAAADLKAALERDPDAVAAYWILLSFTPPSVSPDVTRKILDRGLQLAPASLLLRTMYMASLTPRWGGSHEEMRRFAEESQQFASANPQLAVLRGFVAWDEGYTLWLEGDPDAALQKFTEALSHGEYWHFRVERAHVLFHLDREEGALLDYNRALRQRPRLPEALAGRALAYWYLAAKTPTQRAEYERRARADLERAVQIDPSDHYVRRALAYPGLGRAEAGR